MTFPNIPPVPVNAQTITAAGGALLTNIDAIATQAAAASTQYYATTAAGLAATTNGQYFVLPGDGLTTYANLYRNNAGSAVLVAEASAAAIINSQGYNVLSAGAVGDGVTDDTLAIRSAITSAGVNGVLIFPPGKTFLLTGSLNPMQGQTWIGSGAILKRAAAVSTTTQTAISAASTPIVWLEVADPTIFGVGQDVTVFNGATRDNYNHRILQVDIVGSRIQIDTAFSTAFPAGGTVVRSFHQVDTTRNGANVTDVTIDGLHLNGNSANNTILQYWWVNSEILVAGDRCRVRNCYVENAQAEGILFGGTDVAVEDNHVENCQGNGIHFGALPSTNQAKVTGNFVKNCNLAGIGPGHEDGCIVFSNICADILIANNYCENGIGGIASINSNDNSDVTITGNTIRNCTSYAIGGLTSTDYVQNIIISGNRCYSSGYIYLYGGGAAPGVGVGPRRFVINDNILVLTWIRLFRAYDGVVSGNQINNVGDTTNNAVEVTSCQGVVVQGNNIVGGNRNIVVTGTTNSKEVLVTGNRCRDAYNQGIALFDDAMISCAAIGNSVGVNATFTPATSYVGIMVGNGSTANSNVVNVETNTTGQYGIRCPNGATNTLGAIVCNNQIRSSTNVPSIKLFGGSQNNIVVNNFILQAIAQGGAGAQPNTVTGNITIY